MSDPSTSHDTLQSYHLPANNISSWTRILHRPSQQQPHPSGHLARYFPLCDPASHLQGDISHFDRHLPTTLKNIRNCPGRKIRNDRVTNGQSYLYKSENMLNAQDLYSHLRLYTDTCFLHAALEHILYTLYPHVQHQMANGRETTRINYPPVTFNWRDSIPVTEYLSCIHIPPHYVILLI